MLSYTLRLFVDVLSNSVARLRSGHNRVLYVAEGNINVIAPGSVCWLSSNCAWHGREATIQPGPRGARVLRFELADEKASEKMPDPSSAPIIQATIPLDPSKTYLMRCDRVNLPAASVRQLHVHAGPGIRYLMSGNFHVETAGQVLDINPGQAWFETGPDPVFAASSKTETSHFIRLLVLPSDFLGRRSGRTLHKEDEDKITPSTTELFIDTPIALQNMVA
jgi:hypothetical protein